ncbi:LOW QUALITY PROTEIN: CERCAM isoform 4 [Pongo abelii]|uniref:CERCAM isoform 4 n=1 Tax=Pongo abelii TaxID=9601 RepID=A0A2J8UJT5_PONAB|nr:LOW QUALITY PROTEIN: CERCAM isoform 4 [Pongo abelii]
MTAKQCPGLGHYCPESRGGGCWQGLQIQSDLATTLGMATLPSGPVFHREKPLRDESHSLKVSQQRSRTPRPLDPAWPDSGPGGPQLVSSWADPRSPSLRKDSAEGPLCPFYLHLSTLPQLDVWVSPAPSSLASAKYREVKEDPCRPVAQHTVGPQ